MTIAELTFRVGSHINELLYESALRDDGGSYPGIMRTRCGGVARNHADALTRLGCQTTLVSAIGTDSYGETLLSMCSHMDMSHVLRVSGVQTATYLSVALKGNVLHGITAIEPMISRLTPDVIKSKEDIISDSDAVMVDGNLPTESLKLAIRLAHKHGKFIWFDPADQSKVFKIFEAECFNLINAISPNANEFLKFTNLHSEAEFPEALTTVAETKGPDGVTWWHRKGSKFQKIEKKSPIDPRNVVSVSGAGDCLNSGYMAALLSGLPVEKCHEVADACARFSLLSMESVPSSITPDCLGNA
uniref:PfkB domain-containing protein n=1 Tax=Steinernema glaseri TaxID=37863 RepID=A0A1I7Y460_9BILA